MEKIRWCLKKTIRFIHPNENLASAFINEADNDYNDLRNISPKWQNVVGYYACYNALYAVLMRLGIRSEIHDCSIEIMRYISALNPKYDFIVGLKLLRIDTQYYLQEPKIVDHEEIMSFIISCKELITTINQDEITRIRDEIKTFRN